MPQMEEPLKSERILREISRRNGASDTIDVQEEMVKIVVFISGRNRYAFFGREITEILPACPISWVPGLPDYLPGLINVRGDVESVIDIRQFLGEEKISSDNFLIAMAVRDHFRSGILIDNIEDVLDIPLSTITPPLSTLDGAARDLVIGEVEISGEITSLLDIGKLAAKIFI